MKTTRGTLNPGHPPLWFLYSERRGLGGRTPAVNGSHVREVFARLLRIVAPGPERIAAEEARAL